MIKLHQVQVGQSQVVTMRKISLVHDSARALTTFGRSLTGRARERSESCCLALPWDPSKLIPASSNPLLSLSQDMIRHEYTTDRLRVMPADLHSWFIRDRARYECLGPIKTHEAMEGSERLCDAALSHWPTLQRVRTVLVPCGGADLGVLRRFPDAETAILLSSNAFLHAGFLKGTVPTIPYERFAYMAAWSKSTMNDDYGQMAPLLIANLRSVHPGAVIDRVVVFGRSQDMPERTSNQWAPQAALPTPLMPVHGVIEYHLRDEHTTRRIVYLQVALSGRRLVASSHSDLIVLGGARTHDDQSLTNTMYFDRWWFQWLNTIAIDAVEIKAAASSMRRDVVHPLIYSRIAAWLQSSRGFLLEGVDQYDTRYPALDATLYEFSAYPGSFLNTEAAHFPDVAFGYHGHAMMTRFGA